VYQGKGIAGILSSEISIPKGKTKLIKFFISGSENNKSEITANLTFVKNNIAALFKAKQQRYSELENTATINIPDTLMMKAYRWGKYASDWLKREVPDLGKGMSAGLPDYPWFFSNDQAYTFNALVGTVPPDIFFDSWKMLQTVSDKANNNSGRIIHEASTNGAVYDKGRMEESQLHIIASWNIYKWTGNKTFLKEQYELGEKIWKWLQANETGAGYIKGYGGVEIEGLNDVMLDVQVHTQQFLEVMSKMASVLNNESAAKDYLAKAYFLKQKINEDWWVPEDNRYADFISSKQKAIAIIDSALSKRVHSGRNEWARTKLTQLRENILTGKYNNKGYNVYYNTSGILPLESGIADSAKAKAALQNIDFFTNKFGLYITGIERPDDISMDEGNFEHDKEFNYNRAVMPAATANLIIAACQYGLPDSALKYVHKVLNAFSYATPGTTYEISPDYGMFVQAWNIRAYNIPLIHFFFGIDPTAAEQTVQIHPQMPAQWNYASIKNVLIGNNKLSIDFKKIDKRSIYIIVSEQKGWKEIFTLPAGAHNVSVNGKPVSNKTATIELTKRKNVVEYAEGAQHERKTVI
ncbi:MAG: hypothetical protein LBE82_03475, partial [Chitinophagaceae bacterium]|nr:hypothetical protein [Chitinophagaceae bacterium]